MTIDDADSFLMAHPLGSNPKGPYRSEAIELKDELDTFNNSGDQFCEGSSSAEPGKGRGQEKKAGGLGLSPLSVPWSGGCSLILP